MTITTLFTDTLAQLRELPPIALLTAAAVVVLALLIGLAILLRKAGRDNAATKVTGLATTLGLGWSAQGMWDTAVHRYDQGVVVATVLFVVFEVWLLGRMLRAHQYRKDIPRRQRFVKAVWIGALVMAFVVASGEGWAQAPGRLAIPLLVAYGWWTDLTADDDPAQKLKTSLRWTPRHLGLAIGMLEPTARDAETVDADRHVIRMRTLAFRIESSPEWANGLFRRRERLARLELAADDDMIRRARADLARRGAVLAKAPAEPARGAEPIIPPEPPARRPRPAITDRRPQGVHEIDGKALRDRALHEDGIARLLASVSELRPRGMATAELASLYTPPLKTRTAAGIAAAARKRINGHDLTQPEES